MSPLIEPRRLSVAVPVRLVDRLMTAGIVVLAIGHVIGQYSEHILGHPNLKGLVPRFNMNAELSVATWYATLLLVACASAVAVIALDARRSIDPFTWAWFGLAALFGYIALDEGVAIHELTIAPLRTLFGITEGPLYFAWIIPAAIALLIITVVYRPFVRSLPASTQRGLLLGAALFVAGGLGVEAVAGWRLSTQGDDFAYEMIGGIEEVLELKGAVVLLGTFMTHIRRSIGEVRLSFPPS